MNFYCKKLRLDLILELHGWVQRKSLVSWYLQRLSPSNLECFFVKQDCIVFSQHQSAHWTLMWTAHILWSPCRSFGTTEWPLVCYYRAGRANDTTFGPLLHWPGPGRCFTWPSPLLSTLSILGFLNFFVNAVMNTKYVMLSPTSAFCFLPFESAYTSVFTLFESCCFYEYDLRHTLRQASQHSNQSASQ